ncbi:MAG: PilZ domain-containing protein [Planctomycetes bacterium]|nr:PilZ domain-containing protein [Planctomycetota bacterium]
MGEQRECQRIPADYDAELRAHGENHWWRGSVADIGEKGVRICTRGGPRLEPGAGVWLRIQPKEAGRKLVMRGSVVRCDPAQGADDFEVACEFA